MKNFTQIVISFVFVGLALVACEQDEVLRDIDALAEPTEEDMAAAYLSQTRSLVLFAALKVEHEENKMTGYIIDKYAKLRSVDLHNGITSSMGKANASDAMLRKLHEYSTVVEELPKIELADAYRQARSLSNEDMINTNEDLQSSQLYLAFTRNMEVEHNEACSPGTYSTNHTHRQLLISASGHMEGQNTSLATEGLLYWLRAFEQVGGDQ